MKKITFLLALFLVLFTWNTNAQITTYPYFEDFESGDGGWTVDDPALGSWELGTPANAVINSADSGVNAWVTNLTGEYNANESASVVSPIFDLSSLSAPSIEFSIWWNSEFSWDGMVLQSSIDAGGSWQNVGELGDPNNWFNDGTIGGNPGGQGIGWTGAGANSSGGWVTARHALIGLAGESSVLLRFTFGSDGTVQDEGVAFDSINVFEVACPEPSGITLASVLGTTADISWTAGGAETNWEIVVQTAGTGAPTGSGTSTGSNNPYTESGLTANTDYEVYVRSDCSGEFSSWVGPFNFLTPCGAITPDYNADMSVNVPDACWDEADDGEVADGPSGSGTSDWDDGNTYALGASNAINLWQGDNDREWLLSPAFDLSADGYQLEINVAVTNWNDGFTDDAMGSDDEVQLLQSIDGGATWTTLTTWNAANEPALGGTEYIEDLTGVTGTNVQFAIWASDGTVDDAEDYDFHVGKFRVRTPPTCPEPINLTLDTFTDVTADISWTAGGAETSWEVVVQPAGTGVPTGTGVATAVATFTATGLTATTDYEIWVRGECGPGDLSSWVGPINFTTFNTPPPPPVGVTCVSGSSSFVYTAEFDGLDGWTGDFGGADGTWEIPNDSGSFGTGPDAAFSGGNFMNFESGTSTATGSAVSPAIDLTTAVDGAELSFYMHAFGGDMGTLNVGVSTSATGPFTTEFAWAGDLQTTGTDPWVPIGINLDAYLGQAIYVEFSHTGTGGFEGDMSIDLVRVETCGTFCIAPSSIVISNVTQTTADIDWTANSGETAWEYVVVPLGTGQPTGSGTAVTSTSVTETGLTGSTEFEVWVRADCGGGTFSLWSGPIPFFTAPENNDPCSATTAVVNADESCDLITIGTIFQATPSGIPSGSCAGDPDDDVWFEFTALNDIQIISILNIAGGGFFQDLDHAVYEGSCSAPVELYCSDAEASVTPLLTVGNTYYVRIFSADSDAVDYTFDLCIRPGSGNVLVDQTTYTVAQLVEDILIDSPCAQISNITFSTGTDFGEENGIGYFSNPDGGFPFEQGLLLTSGDASEAAGPNANFVSSGTGAWLGDVDLTAIVGEDTNNATVIEFDFVPLNDELSFDFLMASEEYDMGTFECDFSDAFAFLLTDENNITTNLAVVPGTTDPILVTNIHPDNGVCGAVNEQFFGEYIPDNLPPISFDGRTAVFTAFSQVNIGESYHIKLVIADARDNAFDSGVFLKAGSFDIGEVDLGGDITIAGGTAVCEDQPIVLDTSAPNIAHVWYKDGFVIDGEITSTLTVTEDGTYTVQIIFSPSCIIDDEVLIEFLPNPVVANTPNSLTTCSTISQAQFNLNVNDTVVLGTQNSADFTITYHESQTNANSNSNSLMSPYTNTTNPQTIYVRIEDNSTGCYETTSFGLSISSPTHTAESVEMIGCDNDDDGIASFDLFDHDSEILNGQDASQFNVTYYATQADAMVPTGALVSPYDSSGETIFVRVETVGLQDCYVTNSFDLVIGTEPVTTFTNDFEYEVCPDATVPVIIAATPVNYTVGEVSINWYLDNGLIANENGLTLPVIDAGDYTIEVVFNDTGCSNDETITVIELESCVIPQGISPNNDGFNETFDLSSYGVTKLEIFNRNGTLVYSKKNYTNEWHGQTDGGDELPVGTYFYTMEYQNGKTRSAWIYIQREN